MYVNPAGQKPVVAIVPWGNVIEDYLDRIGCTMDDWLNKITGGWLLGYVSAMQGEDIEPILYCYSREIDNPLLAEHAPTGCRVRLLPAPRVYAAINRHLRNPYYTPPRTSLAHPSGLARAAAYEIAPYLSIARGVLERSLREDGVTAVLVQEYENPRFDRIVSIGRRLGIPVFATFQGGDRQSRMLERYLRPRALRRCSSLIIPSNHEAARVRQTYSPICPIVNIPNPLDLNLWFAENRAASRTELNWAQDERIAIFHGRVDIHRKGLDVLFDAWRNVEQWTAHRPTRLIVVGDGEEHDAFRQLIQKSKHKRFTWITGYTLDRPLMRRMLSAADVAVTASRLEGMPVAPLEAMACGLPLVASDAQGLPEILAEGRASGGIIVQREDADGLAEALHELLEDPNQSTKLGDLARVNVERRFNIPEVGRRLADLILPNRQLNRPGCAGGR